MSAVGRGRRLRGAATLAAALLLFTASLLVIQHRLQRLTGTVAEANSEPWWNLFQARFELERLPHALDRAAAADPVPGAAAQLRTRFDVFWSRLDVMQGGTDNAPLGQLADARRLLDELRIFLESQAPSVDGQPTPGELAELRAGLETFEEPLQSLVVGSVQDSAARQGAVQRRLRDLRSAAWLSLAGLLGSATILVFLLHREVRQTHRLLELARPLWQNCLCEEWISFPRAERPRPPDPALATIRPLCRAGSYVASKSRRGRPKERAAGAAQVENQGRHPGNAPAARMVATGPGKRDGHQPTGRPARA
jgi:hypothetical protein